MIQLGLLIFMESKTLNTQINDLDGEVWVDVFGFENSYSVSNYGRIKGKERMEAANRYIVYPKVLKQCKTGGSFSVNLGRSIGSRQTVKKLVVTSFLRKPIEEILTDKSMCIHSVDWDESNASVTNLKITTFKEVHSLAHNVGISSTENGRAVSIKNKLDATDKMNVYSSGVLIGRICSCCMQEKQISDYIIENRRICKYCRAFKMGVKDIGRYARFYELQKAGLKKCFGCDTIKPITDFNKGTARCKKCKKSKLDMRLSINKSSLIKP